MWLEEYKTTFETIHTGIFPIILPPLSIVKAKNSQDDVNKLGIASVVKYFKLTTANKLLLVCFIKRPCLNAGLYPMLIAHV